jgi:hypothetical protein
MSRMPPALPVLPVLLLSALGAAVSAQAQTTPAVRSDVYHVQFTKAVPGSAAALAKALEAQDPKAPMPGHYIVLRHQQGDDWDFCVIEHLGTRFTVDTAPSAPSSVRSLTAWHADTFVSGPPWAAFAKAMAVDGGGKPGAVYSVAVWRALAGQREKLDAELSRLDSGSKVPVGSVVLQHLEGGPWTFLAIERYNSWQDFATVQSDPGSRADGWSVVRQYASYHHDTLADRLAPK